MTQQLTVLMKAESLQIQAGSMLHFAGRLVTQDCLGLLVVGSENASGRTTYSTCGQVCKLTVSCNRDCEGEQVS